MARPSKTTLTVVGHRTKAELDLRKAAEDALLTGTPMKMWPEVKADKIAAKEFNRVRKLLQKIEKDDGLHEGVINRYALLKSECSEFEEMVQQRRKDLIENIEAKQSGAIDYLEYMQTKEKIMASIVALDRQIQAKRKMLLDIEKENIMTIAAVLRSIPKTPEKKEKSPMAEFIEKRKKES